MSATVLRARTVLRSVLRSVQAPQLPIWFFAILFFVWAFADPRFRDAEGFPNGEFGAPIAASVALAVFGWAMTSRLRRFAGWFALAIVGQAAALQLIEAGTLVRWQHYKPLDRLFTETNPLFLILIAVQTTIVIVGLGARWPRILAWVRSTFSTWQILGVGLVFFLSGAAAQRDVSHYFVNLILAALVQSVSLGNIVLMVWALPAEALASLRQKLERLFGLPGGEDKERAGRVDRFALFAAIWVVVLAATLGLVSYEWHPHITDEVAYVYQARFFANGTITLPAPPVPDAFEIYLMEFKGDVWYPSTLPGWPAMLAIGVRLGVPGLINPLLAGLNVLLTYLLLQELYGRRTARIAVFLLSVSPWYVFMSMNFMNHTFTLTCTLVAAVAVIQARRTGQARWGWLAGLAVGVASLMRPVDGLIVGVIIGLWIIGVGGRRLKASQIVAFVLATIIAGGVALPYNEMLTGSPTTFPLNAYLDSHFGAGRNDLGFGPDRGYGWPIQPFPGHSPLGAMINANLNIFSINVELFGWSTGSLLLLALMLFSGTLRRSDYLMIAVCLTVFGPYFFYYFSGGPDFGARYWFLMLIPLVALTVRGIHFLQRKLDSGLATSTTGGTRVMVAVLSLSLLTFVNYFPWRATDKYHHYWGMRPDVVNLAKTYGFGKSLVLIRGTESHPDFASAAIYNPLDWNADAPIYAWDRSSAVRAELLKAFPDRPVWVVDAPSLTGSKYKVIEGPRSAQELATEETATQPFIP